VDEDVGRVGLEGLRCEEVPDEHGDKLGWRFSASVRLVFNPRCSRSILTYCGMDGVGEVGSEKSSSGILPLG
jgi:hypothetical protein